MAEIADSGCIGSCTEVAERAWTQLIRAHRSALCSVEKALRAADLPPLEWYDVLLELKRGGPLRPRDLQDRLLLAQYNLSRLLDRMEAGGPVTRARRSGDARSPRGQGTRRRRKAAGTHVARLRRRHPHRRRIATDQGAGGATRRLAGQAQHLPARLTT